jgi:hypothetical protein
MGYVGICSNARIGKQETGDKNACSIVHGRNVGEMSIISISEARSKPQPRTTHSLKHDYFVIMATSSIFVGIVLITMLMAPLIITSSSGLTMDDISNCRKKIIESEQKGYYSSLEQFRLAESYCYNK